MNNRLARRQIMILVEGDLEKKLLDVFVDKCFPELGGISRKIQVYHTNIYYLYKEIVSEYSENWTDLDIDIPLLISRHFDLYPELDRNDFTDVIMVFDYERQDSMFDEDKIRLMQSHFSNSSEDGRLFINYPMLESLYDMEAISDDDYYDRKYYQIKAPGGNYKDKIIRKSSLKKIFDFCSTLEKIVENRAVDLSDKDRRLLVDEILKIDSDENVEEKLYRLIGKFSSDDKIAVEISRACLYEFCKMRYLEELKYDYWKYVKTVLMHMARKNILKAYIISKGIQISECKNIVLSDMYMETDYNVVLEKQNIASNQAEKRFIWVLNTFITILGEFKFFWNYFKC